MTKMTIPAEHSRYLSSGTENVICDEVTAIKAARAYVQHRAPFWIMILASAIKGNGKSFGVAYAATALEELALTDTEFFEKSRTGTLCWINVVELGTKTKQEARECIRRAARSWICVLDDLGAEDKWAVPYTREILTVRHTERRATLATTNLAELEGDREGLPTDHFFDRYDERIMSRLVEDGSGANGKARSWIHCPEDTLRGRVRPSMRKVQTPEELEPELTREAMSALGEEALARFAAPRRRVSNDLESDAELGAELLAMLRASPDARSQALLREATRRVRGRRN